MGALLLLGVFVASLCIIIATIIALCRLQKTQNEAAVPALPLAPGDVQLWGGTRSASSQRGGRDVRLGVVFMTRHPIGLESWLNHHKDTIRVEHFFVRAEDSPDAVSLLRTHPWSGCVTLDIGEDKAVSYFSVMDRQNEHVNRSIVKAREMGITHLAHIDDDELLFCPSGVAAFRAHLSTSSASSLHMNNIEAVYDQSDCEDPFARCRWFCVRPSSFTAYVNGKGIGRVDAPDLAAHGPHAFVGSRETMPSNIVVVAHYESACIDRWATKFDGYAKDSPRACEDGTIPFPFYCASIRAAMQTPDARERVWSEWKTRAAQRDGVVELGQLLHRPSLSSAPPE